MTMDIEQARQLDAADTLAFARDRFTIPAGLIGTDSSSKTLPNQYLIFSEVSYIYEPAVGYVMSKLGVKLSDSAYTRPRQSSCVWFAPDTTCTTY